MQRATSSVPGLGALVLVGAAGFFAYYGMHMVSYSLGHPDSQRWIVGVFAVVALGLASGLLAVAGAALSRIGWQPAPLVAVVGAAALLPLVVTSLPLQYDEDPPSWTPALAAAGFLLAGSVLWAGPRRRAWVATASALGGFYALCLVLDLFRD